MSGWRGGVKMGLIIAILFTILTVLVGCQVTLAPADEERISNRFYTMYLLAQIPMPQPEVVYTRKRNFRFAGLTDCKAWTITISYYVAAERPDFVIDLVIPHEYSHLASCFYRGNTDGGVPGNEHDEFWRQWVIRLGGNPDYV